MVGNWPMKHDYTLTCMSKMTMCIQMIINDNDNDNDNETMFIAKWHTVHVQRT